MQADSNGDEVILTGNFLGDAWSLATESGTLVLRHQRHSPPKIMDRSPGGRGAYQSGTSAESSGSSTLRKGWLCLIASMKLARPTYTQLTVTAHCGHLPLQSIPSGSPTHS